MTPRHDQAEGDLVLPVDCDQMLIATPHVSAVFDELEELHIPLATKDDGSPYRDDSKQLGLTRVFLAPNYKDALSRISQERTADAVPPQNHDVGYVIDLLKASFRKKFAGWSPTMGKNREVGDNVIGGGSMIYGGVGDPTSLLDVPDRIANLKALWADRPSSPGAGVRVGVVDTRVLLRRSLAGAVVVKAADILKSSDNERAGHATFVAGLILSVAPGATVEVRGVLSDDGKATSWDAANAIVEMGNSGVQVLNLSFGCITGDGRAPLALATAISLISPKTVVVASAGNRPEDDEPTIYQIDKDQVDILKCVTFPAALDNVIAVGSTPEPERSYSPRGTWIDAYTNGTGVASTFLDSNKFDGFAGWTGTSFSAALVTGAIAREIRPGESARDGWQRLREGSTNLLAADGFGPGDGSDSAVVINPDRWVS